MPLVGVCAHRARNYFADQVTQSHLIHAPAQRPRRCCSSPIRCYSRALPQLLRLSALVLMHTPAALAILAPAFSECSSSLAPAPGVAIKDTQNDPQTCYNNIKKILHCSTTAFLCSRNPRRARISQPVGQRVLKHVCSLNYVYALQQCERAYIFNRRSEHVWWIGCIRHARCSICEYRSAKRYALQPNVKRWFDFNI
jgi:hypothetical protein